MNAVKDYIKERLLKLDFNESNILYFKPLDDSEIKSKNRAAYFYGTNSEIVLSEKGYGSREESIRIASDGTEIIETDNSNEETTETNKRKIIHKKYRNILRSNETKLKVFIETSSIDTFLTDFYESMYTVDSQPNVLTSIEESINSENYNGTLHYDIKSLNEEFISMLEEDKIEIDISFLIDSYFVHNQRIEPLYIDDFTVKYKTIEEIMLEYGITADQIKELMDDNGVDTVVANYGFTEEERDVLKELKEKIQMQRAVEETRDSAEEAKAAATQAEKAAQLAEQIAEEIPEAVGFATNARSAAETGEQAADAAKAAVASAERAEGTGSQIEADAAVAAAAAAADVAKAAAVAAAEEAAYAEALELIE